MATELKCGSCGGTDLSDELKISANGYGISAKVQKHDGGFFDRAYSLKTVARVCVACGFIGFYARQEDREELRNNRGKYKLQE